MQCASQMGNGISPGSAGSGLVGADGTLMVESLSPNELPSDALSGSRKGTDRRGEPTECLLSQWQDVVAHEGEGAGEEEGGKEFLLSVELLPR